MSLSQCTPYGSRCLDPSFSPLAPRPMSRGNWPYIPLYLNGCTKRPAQVVFLIAAAVTLVAGVVLEGSGTAIAGHIGMTGVLFGATFLAASTSIPEVSTGLASVKLGDYQLAFSDIFGGNAFLPVLFLVASLLSGQAVLPQAQRTDIYLAGLGILLTTVYLYGLIFRPRRQVLNMGIDSLVVLLLYALGVVGLIAVAAAQGS